MIDAHCHLNHNTDLKDCIKNAKNNNITHILNNIEIDSNYFCVLDAIKDVDKFNTRDVISNNQQDLPWSKCYLTEPEEIETLNIHYAAGVHPSFAHKINLSKAKKIIEKQIKKLCAIGETGLDESEKIKHPNDFNEKVFKKNLHKQMESLEMHAELCKKYNKPIIIHSRYCEFEDILDIINRFNITGMVHCMTSGPEVLQKILKQTDLFVSFSGIVTFKKNNQEILNSLEACPLDRLLIETDSPYLAPDPHRGKVNEPAFISHTYEFVRHYKNIDTATLVNNVQHNFFKLLQLETTS